MSYSNNINDNSRLQSIGETTQAPSNTLSDLELIAQIASRNKGDPRVANFFRIKGEEVATTVRAPSCPPSPGFSSTAFSVTDQQGLSDLQKVERDKSWIQGQYEKYHERATQGRLRYNEVATEIWQQEQEEQKLKVVLKPLKDTLDASKKRANASQVAADDAKAAAIAAQATADDAQATAEAAKEAFDPVNEELEKVTKLKDNLRTFQTSLNCVGRENASERFRQLGVLYYDINWGAPDCFNRLTPDQGRMIIGTRLRVRLQFVELVSVSQLGAIPGFLTAEVLGEINYLHGFGYFDSEAVSDHLQAKGRRRGFSGMRLRTNQNKLHYYRELGLAIALTDDVVEPFPRHGREEM